VRLLLDTHALLWWLLDDRRLSASARAAIETTANVTFVSAASAWEIAIKAGKGKLRLPPHAESRIKNEMARGGFIELAVTWNHAFAVRNLTGPHLDPFDRLLIAQSQIEGLTMITNDRAMRRYQLDLLW
jgi:PIN domain nuclease of toxin-antitoxin system